MEDHIEILTLFTLRTKIEMSKQRHQRNVSKVNT